MSNTDFDIVDVLLPTLSPEAQAEIKVLQEKFIRNLTERRGKSTGLAKNGFLELLGALIRCGILPLDHPERFKRAKRNFPYD